jgi:hypothetical protein
MHVAAGLRYFWEACIAACCTAQLYNLVWTSFNSQFELWLKAELGSTHGIGLLFYSVSRMEADKTHFVDKVRWTAVARLFSLCRSQV